MRQYFTGRLTNEQFVREVQRRVWTIPGDPDIAVVEAERALWFSYDDLREHPFTDCTMPVDRDARRGLARWVLFFLSDTEFDGRPAQALPVEDRSERAGLRQAVDWMHLAGFWASSALCVTCVAAQWLGTPIFAISAMITGLVMLIVGAAAGVTRNADRSAAGHHAASHWRLNPLDNGVWPFACLADFDAARQRPVFLFGLVR